MARLSAPDEPTFAEFTVVTSTAAFPITFSLFAKADLTVYVDGADIGQAAFSFSGTVLDGGGFDGGTVTLNTAVDDVTVRIERNVAPARTSNFAPAASTPVGSVDQALNRLTMVQQDTARSKAARPLDRAGKFLAFDGDGNEVAVAGAITVDVTVANLESRLIGTLATLPATLQFVRTAGYTTAGDGGEALYKRAASEPAHAGKFRSIDGAWWELAEGTSVFLEQFGAKGDVVISADDYTPTSIGTNDQDAWNGAQDYLTALGGGVVNLMAKTYRVDSGAIVWRGTDVIGVAGRSRLYKHGTGTTTITPVGVAAGGLSDEIYPVGTLPTEINAVMILDGTAGRYIGRIVDVVLIGSMSGTDLDTDMEVELGLVSTGSMSDSEITGVRVFACEQAMLIPDTFTSEITRNRIERCHRGLGVNKFTSLTVHSNYTSDCRDYGQAYRDGIYGVISGNACDGTNSPVLYTDRTILACAYKLLGCDGVSFLNNGQEQTWGCNYRVTGNRDCRIEGNVVFGLGSDYEGTGDVAIWELGSVGSRMIIRNNPVITYKAEGLLSGNADPAKHWNILSNARTDQRPVKWENNTIRETRGVATLSRGYAGAWAGPSPAAGTFGGTANAPMEQVRYDIEFDGVANTVLLGDGVTLTDNGTGNYTLEFDTPFASASDFTMVATTLMLALAAPAETYGQSVHEMGRTADSITIGCQYTNGAYYDMERVGVIVSGLVDRMA